MANLMSKLALALKHARCVKKHSDKGFIEQLVDVIRLYRCNPTCNIFDYYKYGLYKAERGSGLYSELLGDASQESFNRSLNLRNAVTPAWDKLVFSVLCHAYNIRTTEILAIYKPSGAMPDFIPRHLTNIAELKAFLLAEEKPIFVKPVKGSLGQGAFFIGGVDKNCEKISDKNGNIFSFDEFYDKTIGLKVSHRYRPNAGVLFQRIVEQHSAITEFTQTNAPCGLRVVVINTGDGPYIHRATWKIIASENISDNFNKGQNGNLLAKIDIATGKVSDAIDSYWPDTRFLNQHPKSGKKFSSFTLPLWDQVKSEVLNASSIINDIGAMHWDIIISEEGAVFLELNDIGGTNILQLHGQGLIDSKLKAAMKHAAVLQKGSKLARFILK